MLWMRTRDLADANNRRSRLCQRDGPLERSPVPISKIHQKEAIFKSLPYISVRQLYTTILDIGKHYSQ